MREGNENGPLVATYTYNGIGQRIKKVAGGPTRIFHYDQMGHLIAETGQNGQMISEYVYLGNQLLAMIKPGDAVYYYHNDHLGTPRVLTDATGTIAWKAAYNPFGEATISVQAVENPFRFPGQYYDPETGLHYNYFRYYDPTTGRYVTPDPIGLEGGINLFVYVGNNPLNWIDPFGLLRDCDQEQIECFQRCWNQNPPWPIERGNAGHYKYCQTKCLAEYMECVAENEAEKACEKIREVWDDLDEWLWEHLPPPPKRSKKSPTPFFPPPFPGPVPVP